MSVNIGIGISTKKNHLQAVKEATQEALLKIKDPEKAQVAFIFSSFDFCHMFVIKNIANILKNIPILGYSTRIIILPQGILTYGLVIILLDFGEKTYISTAITPFRQKSLFRCGQELAEKLIAEFKDKPRKLNLLFSNQFSEDVDFILGFKEKMGTGSPFIIHSLENKIDPTNKNLIYYKDSLYENVYVALFLGGRVNFNCTIKHGWKPLGKPRIITNAEHNLIKEIEGKPAVTLYQDYFNYKVEQLKKELKYISLLYPLGIYSSEEKDYLLRNIVRIREDGSLLTQGEVFSNTKTRIMIATKESCLDATREAIKESLQDRNETNFLLIFESAARLFLLKNVIQKEIEMFKEINIPFVGTLSYGQLAFLKTADTPNRSQLYNHSLCILRF